MSLATKTAAMSGSGGITVSSRASQVRLALCSTSRATSRNLLLASESHTFGPNTVNQISANALFYSTVFVPSDATGAASALPTFLNFSDGSFTCIGSGAAYSGTSFPQGRRVFQYQLIDDLSHVRGKHTIRAGFNLIHDNITDLAFQENTLGQISHQPGGFFQWRWSGHLDESVFSDCLRAGLQSGIFGAYMADDWKVSDRLTVSLNLRLEHYNDPTCNASCFSRLATPFTGVPANDLNTPYNQLILANQKSAYGSVEPVVWEPRIGLAWTPSKDGKTVIRAGFGIFSDPIIGGFAEYAAQNAPGYVSFTVANGNLAPGVPGSLFVSAAQSNQAFQSRFRSGGSLNSISAAVPAFNAPNFYNYPTRFDNPDYYKWNLELQHTIGARTVLSANYSGDARHSHSRSGWRHERLLPR